jgi:hypothetical protein
LSKIEQVPPHHVASRDPSARAVNPQDQSADVGIRRSGIKLFAKNRNGIFAIDRKNLNIPIQQHAVDVDQGDSAIAALSRALQCSRGNRRNRVVVIHQRNMSTQAAVCLDLHWTSAAARQQTETKSKQDNGGSKQHWQPARLWQQQQLQRERQSPDIFSNRQTPKIPLRFAAQSETSCEDCGKPLF